MNVQTPHPTLITSLHTLKPMVINMILSDYICKYASHNQTHREASLFDIYKTGLPEGTRSIEIEEQVFRRIELGLANRCFEINQNNAVKHSKRIRRILDWFVSEGYIHLVSKGHSFKHSKGHKLASNSTIYNVLKPLPDLKGKAVLLPREKLTSDEMVRVKDADKKQMKHSEVTDKLGLFQAIRKAEKMNSITRKIMLTDGDGNEVSTDLYRVFNDASMNAGGRYYGDYTNISHEERVSLKFDNTPVKEVDFKNMVPRLLYATEGIALEDDAYIIEGFDREDVKIAFQMVVNNVTKRAAIGAMNKKGIKNSNVLLEDILKRHHMIKELLLCGKKVANSLFFIESELIYDVVTDLADSNIYVLPLHDCVICKEDDVDVVADVMISQFNKRFSLHSGREILSIG